MNRIVIMNCSMKLRNFIREMDELEEEYLNSIKKIDAMREEGNYTTKYCNEMIQGVNSRMAKLVVQVRDKYESISNVFKDDAMTSVNEYISKIPDKETLLTLMALKGNYVTKEEFDALLPLCDGNYIATKLLKEIICPSEVFCNCNKTDYADVVDSYVNGTNPQNATSNNHGMNLYYSDFQKNLWRIKYKPISENEISKEIAKVVSDITILINKYAGSNQGLVPVFATQNRTNLYKDTAEEAVRSSCTSTKFLENRKMESCMNELANTFGMRELTDAESRSLDKYYDGTYSSETRSKKTKELISQEPGFYQLITKSQYKEYAEPVGA